MTHIMNEARQSMALQHMHSRSTFQFAFLTIKGPLVSSSVYFFFFFF